MYSHRKCRRAAGQGVAVLTQATGILILRRVLLPLPVPWAKEIVVGLLGRVIIPATPAAVRVHQSMGLAVLLAELEPNLMIRIMIVAPCVVPVVFPVLSAALLTALVLPMAIGATVLQPAEKLGHNQDQDIILAIGKRLLTNLKHATNATHVAAAVIPPAAGALVLNPVVAVPKRGP